MTRGSLILLNALFSLLIIFSICNKCVLFQKKLLSKNQVIQLYLKPATVFHELLKHLLFMSLEQESIKILIHE